MQDNRAAIETIVGDDDIDFDFVNIAPENDETFEPLIDFNNENVVQEEIDPSVKYTYFLSNKEMGGVYNTIEEAERALRQLEDVPQNKTKRRKKGTLPHNIYYTYTHDGVTPIGHYKTLQELRQKRIDKIFLKPGMSLESRSGSIRIQWKNNDRKNSKSFKTKEDALAFYETNAIASLVRSKHFLFL
jgi:hypothetical protein